MVFIHGNENVLKKFVRLTEHNQIFVCSQNRKSKKAFQVIWFKRSVLFYFICIELHRRVSDKTILCWLQMTKLINSCCRKRQQRSRTRLRLTPWLPRRNPFTTQLRHHQWTRVRMAGPRLDLTRPLLHPQYPQWIRWDEWLDAWEAVILSQYSQSCIDVSWLLRLTQ